MERETRGVSGVVSVWQGGVGSRVSNALTGSLVAIRMGRGLDRGYL